MIEIVTHCYAVRVGFYAKMLRRQLESLVDYEDIRFTLCVYKNDRKTLNAVEPYLDLLDVKVLALSKTLMSRRCFGRNIAARGSEADIVWFSDVDQMFREGILDRLKHTIWDNGTVMVFPRMEKRCRNRITMKYLKYPDMEINPNCFKDWYILKPIGAMQIVRGNFARKHGYIPNCIIERNREPFSRTCNDDVVYRRFCATKGDFKRTYLPGVYRFLHHIRGREV
jgi:hypothetical protein